MNLLLLILTIAIVSCKDLNDVDFDDDDEKPPPIVRIEDGVIRGGWKESRNGRQFAIFERIPYAKPPVGELRFKAPQPPQPWKETFNATGSQENCLQYEPFFGSVSGREDCLIINVYTPRAKSWANMPVLVVIPGGAFYYGAGYYYDPVRVMDWDIVVVTFNYRLGPFGFLSTGDEVIPGNAGLKDQTTALRWVQKNIRTFGGDPESVTIAGHSAGAASVHYHYLSPLSKGLFSRGVTFSGSAFAPWAFKPNPLKHAKRLATTLNCSADTSQEIADCLMNKSADDILTAALRIMIQEIWFSPFVPTAETESAEAFITAHPYEVAKSGAVNRAPLLVSSTADEGLYPAAAYHSYPEQSLRELEENWTKEVPKLFQFKDTLPEEQWAGVASKIKHHYFGDKPVSEETFPNLVQAVGDRIIMSGIGKMAALHALANQTVHMYKYSFKGETRCHIAMTHDPNKNLGVGHGDDVFHIFYLPLITPVNESAEELKINDLMISLLFSYCKTGIPKLPIGSPAWTPISSEQSALDYMEIASPVDLQMRSSSDFGQKSFWDSFEFNENQNYKKNMS